MAKKNASFNLIIDSRPDVNSGVFATSPTLRQYQTFDEAIKDGAIVGVGEQQWNMMSQKLKSQRSSYEISEDKKLLGFSALVGLHSKDLQATTEYNRLQGFVDDIYNSSIVNSASKSFFFQEMKKKGFAHPLTYHVNDGVKGVIKLLKAGSFKKTFIKPAEGSGSIGVVKVDFSDSNSNRKINDLSGVLAEFSEVRDWVVMEAIDGVQGIKEYSINAIIIEGISALTVVHAKTEQSQSSPFRDYLVVTHKANDLEQEQAEKLIAEVIDTLGITVGVIQLEVRPNSEGQWLPIDVSLRPDGGLMPETILATRGIDFRLAHTYAQVGALDKLDHLVSNPIEIQASFAAIGAFYGRKINDKLLVEMYQLSTKSTTNDSGLWKVVFGVDFSNIGLQPVEIRAAMCSLGDSAEEAVANLKLGANKLGLVSGSCV